MKKLLALLLSVCFILAISIFPVFAMNETSERAKLKAKMDAQRNAVIANELLYETFERTPFGYVYPSNFAGTYIENNILHILWTDLNEKQQQFYDNLFADYNGYYSYKIVEYSYAELQELCEKTYDEIKTQVQVTGYGVDVLSNRAKIGVAEHDYKKINQDLQFYNRSASPIYFVEGKEAEASAKTLMGGTSCSSNEVPFTLGMCGTYDGADAAVTCGHGMTLNGAVKQLSTTVGTIDYIQTSYGDFSIILTNSNAILTNRVKTGGTSYVEIEGTINNPPVGAIVSKYGKETLYCEYGEVTDTDYTAFYSDFNLRVRGLHVAEWDECASIPGDSGGPYIMEDFGQTVFCGIQSGHITESNGTITLFTPYHYIDAAGFDAQID